MAVNATNDSDIPPLKDLCLFRQDRPGERPPADAGAAMLALIAQQLFPAWALAFYEPLSQVGAGHRAPLQLALIADDAILLAPQQQPGGWRGFIVAEGQAQGQTRAFRWPGDPHPCCWLAVPHASGGGGATWGEEAAFLSTQPSPDTPDSPEIPLL